MTSTATYMAVLRPTLPPELIREVTLHIDSRHDLVQLVTLSENWRCEIERRLYAAITLVKHSRKHQALTADHLLTLCPRIGRLITSLNAGLIKKDCKSMKPILGSTPNLRALEMNFRYDYRNTPFRKYVPNGSPPFLLRRFVTDHDGSLDLCAFLKTQPALEQLYLGVPHSVFKLSESPRDLPGLLHLRTFHANVALAVLEGQKIEQLHFFGHVVELFSRLHGQQFPTVKALAFALNHGVNINIFASVFPNVRHLQTYIVSHHRLLSCKSVSNSYQSRAQRNYRVEIRSFSRLEALYLLQGEDDDPVEELDADLVAVVLSQFEAHPTLNRVYLSRHDGPRKRVQYLRGGVVLTEEGNMSSPFGSTELPPCTLWGCPDYLRRLSY